MQVPELLFEKSLADLRWQTATCHRFWARDPIVNPRTTGPPIIAKFGKRQEGNQRQLIIAADFFLAPSPLRSLNSPYPRPMPLLPQELINKIIDELGRAYRDPDRRKHPDNDSNEARQALHACSLVSENWTHRSRMYLFKKVRIKADESGRFRLPPKPVMPYITS